MSVNDPRSGPAKQLFMVNVASGAVTLMSTHALDYSIPVSSVSETLGVRRASWLQRYP
jgi:hypothetical protein